MKLLIFSDTHFDTRRMEYAVEQVNPDVIIHLGDNIDDIAKIRDKLLETPLHFVKGNVDTQTKGDIEKLIFIDNIKILLTHGHEYHVKEGLSHLIKRATELGADLVLFGHTHGAAIVNEQGITLMNPGQMQFHKERQRASYGVVTITDGKFDCEIVYLPSEMYNEFY
jgi:putative phosphoesterase